MVLLPAPFSPSRQCTSPSATRRLAPLQALVPGKVLTISVIVSMSCLHCLGRAVLQHGVDGGFVGDQHGAQPTDCAVRARPGTLAGATATAMAHWHCERRRVPVRLSCCRWIGMGDLAVGGEVVGQDVPTGAPRLELTEFGGGHRDSTSTEVGPGLPRENSSASAWRAPVSTSPTNPPRRRARRGFPMRSTIAGTGSRVGPPPVTAVRDAGGDIGRRGGAHRPAHPAVGLDDLDAAGPSGR